MDFFRVVYKARKDHQVTSNPLCEALGSECRGGDERAHGLDTGLFLFHSLPSFPPSLRSQYLACMSGLQKPVEFFCYHGLYAFPLGQRIVKTMGAMEQTIVSQIWAKRSPSTGKLLLGKPFQAESSLCKVDNVERGYSGLCMREVRNSLPCHPLVQALSTLS